MSKKKGLGVLDFAVVVVVAFVALFVGALVMFVLGRPKSRADIDAVGAPTSRRRGVSLAGGVTYLLADAAGTPLMEVETLPWPANSPVPTSPPIAASAPIAALISDLAKSAMAEAKAAGVEPSKSVDQMYRFVARAELLGGIAEGTLEQLPQMNGLGAAVRDVATKKIVGQGAFEAVAQVVPAASVLGPEVALLAATGMVALAIVEAEQAIRADIQRLQESVDQLKLDALADDVATAKNASNTLQSMVAVLVTGQVPLVAQGGETAAADIGRGFEKAEGWLARWEAVLADPEPLDSPKVLVQRFTGLDRPGGETDVKAALVSAWSGLYRQRVAVQLMEAARQNPNGQWTHLREHLAKELERADAVDRRLASLLERIADLELEVNEGLIGRNSDLSTALLIQKRATKAARLLRARPVQSNDVVGRNALGQVEMQVLARANGELHVLPPRTGPAVGRN